MGIKCVFPVILLWWNCHFINSKSFLVAISERWIGSKNVSSCSTMKFKFLFDGRSVCSEIIYTWLDLEMLFKVYFSHYWTKKAKFYRKGKWHSLNATWIHNNNTNNNKLKKKKQLLTFPPFNDQFLDSRKEVSILIYELLSVFSNTWIYFLHLPG